MRPTWRRSRSLTARWATQDLARVDQTFRRTAGQGIAAEAVTNLDKAVRATAKQAGPDVFRALMEGRAATVNKLRRSTLLDKLARRTGGGLQSGDEAEGRRHRALRATGADRAERTAAGRARVAGGGADESHGGRRLGRAQGLLAEWQNLGPQTKQLLFGDPAHVKDLDHFFLLAKKMPRTRTRADPRDAFKGAEPLALGREALMLAAGLGTGYTFTAPFVAKLLLSPTTMRLSCRAAAPISARTARAAWQGNWGGRSKHPIRRHPP